MSTHANFDFALVRGPAEHVRHCLVEGRVVLLDLRVGNYIVLDELASRMWCAVANGTGAIRASELADMLGLTEAQCEIELRDFVEGCQARGLLAHADQPTEHRSAGAAGVGERPGRPTAFHAWRCMLSTRVELSRSGFSTVYRRARALRHLAPAASPPQLETAVHSFSCAENFLPIRDARTDCLPRSLSLHRFLRSVGIDAAHLIGVRRFPFGAHAWVEVGGDVVCDARAFVSQFTEISRA